MDHGISAISLMGTTSPPPNNFRHGHIRSNVRSREAEVANSTAENLTLVELCYGRPLSGMVEIQGEEGKWGGRESRRE
jgi:hypothetical protein